MAKKEIIGAKEIGFLRSYLNNPSPTGFESGGQKIWLDYVKPFVSEYITDNYGSVAGIVNPDAEYKVVVEAHADEISWFVHYINEDGFIYVIRNGGSDHQIAPSKRVNIHTKKGTVKAVFGWPAIHTRKISTKDNVPKAENIFLDAGCTSRKQVHDLGIHVGCVVTYDDEFMVMNNRFVSRALDNRIGGFMIAQVARLLKEDKKKLPFGLYLVNSVQEEVGLRGAQMISSRIKPDVAIITDVGHDTSTPMISKVEQGELYCGKGPIFSYAPSVHNKLLDLMISVAEKNSIPFQREANSRGTGTDTDAFAYSNQGVVSALVSLPIRYMHTTVEMAFREDVEDVIKLVYQLLLNIRKDHDFKYIH